MEKTVHVVCPHCDAVNRVGADKPALEARCGKCHRALFEGRPAALSEGRFERHLQRSGLPLVVDFWAEWCGPCKMMAPLFEEAARRLEPRVRFAKVDTDRNQELAARFGIRGIPTLILFEGGREVDRATGAMDLTHLLQWVERHL